MKGKRNIFILSALILFTLGCEAALSLRVQISRDAYKPNLDQSKFAEYKGQTIIFDSIDAEAPNREPVSDKETSL